MPAAILQTPVPVVRVVANDPNGIGRRLRLIMSPGGGNKISIQFPTDAKVLALGLAGAAVPIPVNKSPDKALLRCTGRACEGLTIEVVLGDRRPIEAELFSTRFGLPPEARPLLMARPSSAIPQYSPDQSITRSIVRL
jgi:hypothetical protein